jgi:hypothetical protein
MVVAVIAWLPHYIKGVKFLVSQYILILTVNYYGTLKVSDAEL